MSSPTAIVIIPLAMLTAIAQCTDSCTSLSLPAPNARDTTTLAPTDKPINTLIIKLTSGPLEPTAARAVPPAQRATTIISAALYNSCSSPVAISGSAYRITPGKRGPLIISTGCFFIRKSHPYKAPFFAHEIFCDRSTKIRPPALSLQYGDGSRLRHLHYKTESGRRIAGRTAFVFIQVYFASGSSSVIPTGRTRRV